MLRIVARRVGLGLLIVAALFVMAAVATARWQATAACRRAATANHGYHSGIVLPSAPLAEQDAAGPERARPCGGALCRYDRLEIGWGDEGFYREVPTVASLTVKLALRALVTSGQPLGIARRRRQERPARCSQALDVVRIGLGERDRSVWPRLEASFARDKDGLRPQELGAGLYGPSLFFRANGTFNVLHVPNHRIVDLLDAAGVPTAP